MRRSPAPFTRAEEYCVSLNVLVMQSLSGHKIGFFFHVTWNCVESWYSYRKDLIKCTQLFWRFIQKRHFTFVIILIMLNTFLSGTNITESFMLQLKGYVKGAVSCYTQKISQLPEICFLRSHVSAIAEIVCACQKTSKSESLSACQSFCQSSLQVCKMDKIIYSTFKSPCFTCFFFFSSQVQKCVK